MTRQLSCTYQPGALLLILNSSSSVRSLSVVADWTASGVTHCIWATMVLQVCLVRCSGEARRFTCLFRVACLVRLACLCFDLCCKRVAPCVCVAPKCFSMPAQVLCRVFVVGYCVWHIFRLFLIDCARAACRKSSNFAFFCAIAAPRSVFN